MNPESLGQHVYIQVLEYAVKHGEIDVGKAKEDLRKEDEFLTKEFGLGIENILQEIGRNKGPGKYHISYKSFLDYLEYIELKEARESAVEAKKQANKAQWTAVAAIMVSIALGVLQIFLAG